VTLAKLQSPPRHRDTHLWADYAELICLINVDGRVTKADILGRWEKADDLELDLAEAEEEIEVDADEPEIEEAVQQPPDVHRAAKLDDVFRHLAYRQVAFDTDYPFQVLDDVATLQRRRVTRARRLYVYLLIASSQRYLEARSAVTMTREFEHLAFLATRAWLPTGSRVYQFGTDRARGNRYRGRLRERLRRLAEDVNEELKVKEGDLSTADVGDAGCDVVAWIPLGDDRGTQLVVIGQATCQVKWKNKQGEPSWDAWRRLIDFTVPTNAMFFIPFCWRRPDGQWFKPLDVRTILVDRLRLMWLLGNRRVDLPEPVLQALTFREAP
jgi:hypothetical protein